MNPLRRPEAVQPILIVALLVVSVSFHPISFLSHSSQPKLRKEDQIRIGEARRIAESLGENVWPGWKRAPFSLILVTQEYEYLMFHENPSDDFKRLSYDPVLGTQISVRPRQYQTNLLATFPAVGGVPTIVIGQPENTAANSSLRWVIVVLHEHFHQLQNSDPTYYDEVANLKLSKGDETGMWMLNYPFPYSNAEVNKAFYDLSIALLTAIKSRGLPSFNADVNRYLTARRQFKNLLTDDDYRYFSFQVWQEGVARYTELRMSELIRERYSPTSAFQGLDDMRSLASEVEAQRAQIMKGLARVSLQRNQRSAFYTFGAGEALLIDTYAPSWKNRYLREKFYMERYYQ